MFCLRSKLSAVLAGAMAAALVSTPAHGAEAVFVDDRRDAPARVDIQRVKVVHNQRAIRTVVKVANLRWANQYRTADDAVVFVDTHRKRVGPEFYGSFSGNHWYFGRMRQWRIISSGDPDNPFTGGCRGFRADYDVRRDRVTFRMPRTDRCVGTPRRLRVAAYMSHAVGGDYDDLITDWAPARRTFYRQWVRVG